MTHKVYFQAHSWANPTAVTVLINGHQAFSGQLGSGTPMGENFDSPAMTTDFENGETATVTVSCTSGIVSIGSWLLSTATPVGYAPPEDLRVSESVLVNGQPPEYPASPVFPMPRGNINAPDWTGWFFEISAGETLTFNVKIPAFDGSDY